MRASIAVVVAAALLLALSSAGVAQARRGGAAGPAISASGTSGISASADAFHYLMTDNGEDYAIFGGNFELKMWQYQASSGEELDAWLAGEKYNKFLANAVYDICMADDALSACREGYQYVNNRYAFIEREDAGYVSDVMLASVFWHLDGDNWFSLATMQDNTSAYLQSGWKTLLLVKGFPNRPTLLTGGITYDDLVVVVDKDEDTITIWAAQLFD